MLEKLCLEGKITACKENKPQESGFIIFPRDDDQYSDSYRIKQDAE